MKASKKETENFLLGITKIMFEKSRRIEDFKIIILVVMIGSIGGIVGNFLYDISKMWDNASYLTINITILVIFLILIWAILSWFNSWENEVKNWQEVFGHISKHGLTKPEIPKTNSV